ncbi:hypothetical protein GCM10009760_09310 [Kitasatospora kazusensis]|uniref:UvrD-like helicase C-terminal domain-containing protein n=1 Tax=Kitasatospora kazusensis TaxID=407974 RepID=A0ABN2YW05_9ACTN
MTPAADELLPEQSELLHDLPAAGHHLVDGPPGSGKSALAVHRALALAHGGHRVALVSRSNLLRQRLQRDLNSAPGATAVPVTTYHKWVIDWHRRSTGAEIRFSSDGSFDWDALAASAISLTAPPEREWLVVDEGQDLPVQFYLLCRLLGTHLTVFADEYQCITDQQSTLAEISQALGAPSRHTIAGNLRNSRQISRLAQEFTLDRTSVKHPEREGPLPSLMPLARLSQTARWIAEVAAAHRGQSTGVILRHTQGQKDLLGELARVAPRLKTQTYIASAPEGRYRTVDASRPGLTLVNRASAKGLEFDTVVVPDTHLDTGDPTAAAIRMLYYVMATRARHRLYFGYAGPEEPPMLAHIPPFLLERPKPKSR